MEQYKEHGDNGVAQTLHLPATQTHFCNHSFSIMRTVAVRTNQDHRPNQESTRHFTVTSDLLFSRLILDTLEISHFHVRKAFLVI